MAARDPRLVGITPAMREGSGMVRVLASSFPERYFDVGIAEQHAVTFAAGLACEGMKPVVAIYSTFLQRGYDQLIHDVAMQNLPVLFALDRAGLVGADGATHAGAFDFAYLRCIPNMTVMAPADENECRQMLYTGVRARRPGGGALSARRRRSASRSSRSMTRAAGRQGRSPARGQAASRILAFGAMLKPALEAAEALDATVANMRFVKPLDAELVRELAQRHELLVTVEEHQVMGGAGSAVCEALAGRNRSPGRAARPARPLHRPRRSGAAARFRGAGRAGIAKSIRSALGQAGVSSSPWRSRPGRGARHDRAGDVDHGTGVEVS